MIRICDALITDNLDIVYNKKYGVNKIKDQLLLHL